MRYVTNEQRRRRTLFKLTLWAVGQLADFPRCSLLTSRTSFVPAMGAPRSAEGQNWCGMLVVRALKISQLTDGGMPPTYDSVH